jgi:hypothetical protein
MKQKQIFIILGALGVVFLVFWAVVLTLVIKTLRGSSSEDVEVQVTEVTLCDENASDLCVITFGANSLNRMVIYFQLPDAEYAPFYIKADNREKVSVYSCEVDEAMPTSAYCTGIRTPLGETIDVEVYTVAENKLIGRGTFLILAIALSTPVSAPVESLMLTEEPTAIPIPDDYILPPQTEEPYIPPIPTPDYSYPN